MPMPVVPKSLYPLVPFAPGVPAVLRSGAAVLDALTLNKLGIGDMLSSFLGTSAPRWGIYDDSGGLAVPADSVESFAFENNWRVSNYPIEGGKFSAYNKVADPYDINIRLTCGSAIDNRVDFMSQLDYVVNSLDLFTVVTPETTYTNANVVDYSYRRDSVNGANKIIADVHIVEVRQVDSADFGKTKSDTSASEVSLGQVQPVDDVSFDPSEFV